MRTHVYTVRITNVISQPVKKVSVNGMVNVCVMVILEILMQYRRSIIIYVQWRNTAYETQDIH